MRRIKPAEAFYNPACPSEPWPEVLIGIAEIARFLRVSPSTAKRLLASGIPSTKDGLRRFITTRRAIELWILRRHFYELATHQKGPNREKRKRHPQRKTTAEQR